MLLRSVKIIEMTQLRLDMHRTLKVFRVSKGKLVSLTKTIYNDFFSFLVTSFVHINRSPEKLGSSLPQSPSVVLSSTIF